MKFTLFATAAVVVVSTANAHSHFARCDVKALMPILSCDEAAQCEEESGFNFKLAYIMESPPKPDQYGALCKIGGVCERVIRKIYAAVPTDCALQSGKPLKSLTEAAAISCAQSFENQRRQYSSNQGADQGRQSSPNQDADQRRQNSPDQGADPRRQSSPDQGADPSRQSSPDQGADPSRQSSLDQNAD